MGTIGMSGSVEELEGVKREVEKDCNELRAKLRRIQAKRRQIRRLLDHNQSESSSEDLLSNWTDRKIQSNRERDLALDEYISTKTSIVDSQRWLELSGTWTVTNDCFHIWHKGPFGTINGLRLGGQIPLLSGLADTATQDDAQKSTENGNGSSLMGTFSFHNFNAASHPTSLQKQNGTTNVSSSESLRVPWVEVNSALGLVALLLGILEKKPNSGIQFTNKLVPMGSTSRIGVKRTGETYTFYNLYSDDSFNLFGKRSFNVALNGLLKCVMEAGEAVQSMDRTMALPHPISATSAGEFLVESLSINYTPDGEAFTKACKYMLTDIKWVVAYTTKHVDR